MIDAWWFIEDGNNFGDILCPNLLHMITGEQILRSDKENSLASIGSILFYPFSNKKIIWGSGAIDEKQKSEKIKEHDIRAVRGPKTRKRLLDLGLDCPEIYGDPALLLPIILTKESLLKNVNKKYKIGVIPHWIDYDKVSRFSKIKSEDILLIDILSGVQNVLKNLISCDIIITSSLHGLIVAESYSIPTVFVEFGSKLYGRLFKFEDYFNSTDRDLKFLDYKEKYDLNLYEIDNFLSLNYNQNMNIDLKKLIRSFPYEIKNKNLLNYLGE